MLLSILFVLFTSSCNKNDRGEKVKILDSKTDEEWVNVLSRDENFIANSKLDEQIFELDKEDRSPYTTSYSISMDSIVQLIQKAQTVSEVREVFVKYQVPNAEKIVDLIEKKAEVLQKVVSANPELVSISNTRLNNIVRKINYSKYRSSISNAVAFVPKDPCKESYTVSVNSCDNNFSLATGAALFSGGVAALASGPAAPIVGSGTVVFGIAIAYIAHTSCINDVEAQYKICKDNSTPPTHFTEPKDTVLVVGKLPITGFIK